MEFSGYLIEKGGFAGSFRLVAICVFCLFLAVAVVSSCLLDVVLRGFHACFNLWLFGCWFCVFGRCCLLYRSVLDLQSYRIACSTCSFCFARCLLFALALSTF